MSSTSIVKNAREITNLGITELPFLVEGLLQKTGLATLVGQSDVGKSTFLKQLCLSIVTGGNEFLGRSLNCENRKVLYVSSEDDEISTSYLFNSAYEENILSNNGLSNFDFLFDTRNLSDKLESLIQEKRYSLIVIDAFGDVYPGPMNHYNEVRNYLENYYRLANEHRCLILILHHIGKRTEHLVPSKNNILGSQGFEGKMRIVLELRKDNRSNSKRHICILKGNYLDDDDKSKSIELTFENRIFTPTGNRVELRNLVNRLPTKKEEWFPDLESFFQVHGENKSTNDYLELLESIGADVSRSSVGSWLRELRGS